MAGSSSRARRCASAPQQPVQILPFDAQSAGIAGIQLHRHQPLRRPRAASLQPDRTAVRIVEGEIAEAR